MNSQNIIKSLTSNSTGSSNDIVGNINVATSFGNFMVGVFGIVLVAFVGSITPVWFTTRIRPLEALKNNKILAYCF